MALRTRVWTTGTPDISLRDAFAEALQQGLAERAGTKLSLWDWAMRVPEPKAGILDFNAFPFQRELYAEHEDDREMVIQKSTQVGCSAWSVRWAMYHCDIRGATGMYIFPTSQDVYDWGDARVKPVIDASPYLRSRIQPEDPANKGLRKIGLGFLFFRGSESKRKLDSVDADHLVLDEYDTLAQANIPDAERRLSGPLSKGLIRRLGVPSIPAYGIAKTYDDSDQRKWMVKCEGCTEWQALTFHENVDQKSGLRVCRKCMKPLDVAKGQWVATYPERDVRGYHITRLIAPTLSMEPIIKASKKRAPGEVQVFWNKDLGEPYAPAEGRLSREALQAAQNIGGGFTQVPGYVGSDLVTMGIDVASTRALTIRISAHPNDRRKIALFIGEVESFNELELLMDRYGVNMAVIDHLPEGRLARAFAEKFPGRVYLVAFDTTPNPKTADVVKINEEMRFVSVRRTELMDATAELIRAQKNALPLDLPHGYVEAMQAPVRVVVRDDLGRNSVTYRSAGADDYFMAEAYDVVASEMWLYRTELDRVKSSSFRQLDDMLEFERSHLGDYDGDPEYRPGGREQYDDPNWG
jgi:hypothetical protein